MWRHLRGVLIFLLLLALLPLVAIFLLKLLILAGSWTLESLTEPLYAITAGVVLVVVLAIGIWMLVASNGSLGRTTAQGSRVRFQSATTAAGQATAYCNACGNLNWADVPTCHYCQTKMTPVSQAQMPPAFEPNTSFKDVKF